MITKTFGIGGDYPDLGTAWGSIVNTVLSDDYDFLQISDFVESIGVDGASGSKNVTFNGHTVKFSNPDGYNIITAHPYFFRDDGLTASTNDVLIIDSLRVTVSGDIYCLFRACAWWAHLSMSAHYKNLLLIGPGISLQPSAIGFPRWGNSERVLNCRVLNFFIGINCTINDANTTGNSHEIQNNSICSCGSGIKLGQTTPSNFFSIKNTVSFDNETIDFASGGSNNIITNCADSDNSIVSTGGILSGNITGISIGDFLGIDPGNSDFLKIHKDSLLYESGSKLISPWNIYDFIGHPRPNIAGNVGIGAHEPLSFIAIMRVRVNGLWYAIPKQIKI